MQAIPTDTCALSRGWQLGDGHFTTLHAPYGRIRHWPYHRARLSHACERLHMPMPNWQEVKSQLLAHLDATADQVVRITLVRGRGGRGYSIQGCERTQVVITVSSFPAHYYQWRQQGIEIGVCQGRLGCSPLLAGLKTINRLEQVLLKTELERHGWSEALVCDSQGRVQEAVTANVFWRTGEHIFTPVLSELGVWGTMRAWSQDYLGARLTFTQAPLSEVFGADEVWLSNALLGIVAIKAIIGPPNTDTAVLNNPLLPVNRVDFNNQNSQITKELQQAYEKTN
ncbi:aminodeoxychorismate lyase [Oceanisphaera avium]|uniref:Aminodeoxychorismate lyase n=1 Tax=Oceanisphaera avium TaxID=1903694 RepID=A0A1Y0D0I3_9GAMM|nr:aminodeoxychorismate lyase [Oceanisphaera avium]ART81089.1 aminodeoxychorismate lyase [Oceanisphaera avium]